MNFQLFGKTFGFSKKELSQFVNGLVWAVVATVVNYVLANLGVFHLTTTEAFFAGSVLKAVKQVVDGKL